MGRQGLARNEQNSTSGKSWLVSIARGLSKLRCTLNAVALLTIFYALGARPPILVTLGSAQTVETRNQKMGVHTRLTDEVEEWKIKKTLEMVREMGAPWVVDYFPWAYIENGKGEFDWDHADRVVDHAERQGLTIIARLGFVPAWARPKDSAPSMLDAAHYTDFAQFVNAFVAHFRGRIRHVIIWNEPNLNFEWGYQPVDPAGYVQLLQQVYPAAKEADPMIQVLAGALAPTLAPPGATDAMSDLEYLQRMYDAGAKDYFDILAVHSYGWRAPADEEPAPDKVNFRRIELVREIMVQNGDATRRVMITEGGWNDHPRWTKAVRPADRIANTLRAYEMAQAWDWADAIALWAFRYPAPAQTYQDYFTFVTPEFARKPIYLEVSRYAGQ